MGAKHKLLLAGAWLLICAGCSALNDDHPLAVAEQCEICHALPPLDSTTTEMHHRHVVTEKKTCNQCHYGYSEDTGWTLVDSIHRNGRFDYDSTRCTICHTYRTCDSCHASPPFDQKKNPRAKRAHENHVTRQNFQCDTCHKGYDVKKHKFPEATHNNGKIDVVFDAFRKPGFERKEPFYKDSACYNLYCHGAFTLGGKPSVAIYDTEPQDSTKCSFCHNIDTLLNVGYPHSVAEHKPYFRTCLVCHDGFSLVPPTANPAKHHQQGVLHLISQTTCDITCHKTPHQPY